MIRNDRWTSAGIEPRLSDMLSDPTTRHLMSADGISADDVNAVIARIRRDVRPARLVPLPAPEKKAPERLNPVRHISPPITDRSVVMRVASGVVSRWTAALAADKRLSFN